MGKSLLRSRDFRLVAGSVGLSALGDWVAIVALGLHIKEVTDSGFAVAGLWVCLFGPSVAVAGPAGLLVDRIEATRLLAAISLLGAAVAAVLGLMTATAPVLALTALLGCVFALSQPAEFSLVPPLAGDGSRRRTATSKPPATSASGSARSSGDSCTPPAGSTWLCSSTRQPSPPLPAPRWRFGFAAIQPAWPTPSARHERATASPSSFGIESSRCR